MSIILKDTIVVTKKYSGKSKYEFWSTLDKGDVVVISLPLKKTGRGASGIYSPVIKLKNMSKNIEHSDSFNVVQKYLDNIEYVDIIDEKY